MSNPIRAGPAKKRARPICRPDGAKEWVLWPVLLPLCRSYGTGVFQQRQRAAARGGAGRVEQRWRYAGGARRKKNTLVRQNMEEERGVMRNERAVVLVPKDINNDGIPDVWFEDKNGDGVNDLLIDPGNPPGISEALNGTYGCKINGHSQILIFHSYATSSKAFVHTCTPLQGGYLCRTTGRAATSSCVRYPWDRLPRRRHLVFFRPAEREPRCMFLPPPCLVNLKQHRPGTSARWTRPHGRPLSRAPAANSPFGRGGPELFSKENASVTFYRNAVWKGWHGGATQALNALVCARRVKSN